MILFVDISGFTNLCTRVCIDALQFHINEYFGALIECVHIWGGDVLRFAGDAILCAWALAEGPYALTSPPSFTPPPTPSSTPPSLEMLFFARGRSQKVPLP